MQQRLPIAVLAVLCSGLATSGCTRLLGIDEEYELMPEADSVSLDAGERDADEALSTGGPEKVDAAGLSPRPPPRPISGDVSVAPPRIADGGPPCTDCPASDAAADGCLPGRYEGTLSGEHAPGAVPFPVDFVPVQGTVQFTLAPLDAGSEMAITQGQIQGDIAIATTGSTSGAESFTAQVTGSVDCASGRVTGNLVDGSFGLPGFELIRFEGEFSGRYDGASSGIVDGEWKENELLPPLVPGAGRGSGQWAASWVGF